MKLLSTVEAVKEIMRVVSAKRLKTTDAFKLGRACAALGLETTDTVKLALYCEYGPFLAQVRAGWAKEYLMR